MIAKPTRGRPAKPAAEQLKTPTIRLNDADFAKLKAIGIDRLRAWINNARAGAQKG